MLASLLPALHVGELGFGVPGSLLCVALAATLSWSVIWLLQPLAIRFGLVDHPNCKRKDHGSPIPVTGGLGIFAAVLLSPLFFHHAEWNQLLGFALGVSLLMLTGVLDDLHDLHWSIRILAQALAAILMIYVGGVRVEQLGPVFGMDDLALGWLSTPFTVFATIGLINAINMIDGVDGLCGSLLACTFLMLCGASLYAGNMPLAMISLALMGSILGFLAHNFSLPWRKRARVFLGNGGSAMLGFCVAWIAFSLTQNSGHPVSPVLALCLLPFPIMDCLILIIRRVREGRSPFSAGRDHIHHLMRDSGHSSASLSITLCILSLLSGLIAGILMMFGMPDLLMLICFGLICYGWLLLSSNRPKALQVFAMFAPAHTQTMPERTHSDTA